MRVSIYARYSSDKQREASIEDQVRLCEERAAREGWRVVKRYTDHAISGASLMRRGHSGVDAGCAKREVRSGSYGVAGPHFSRPGGHRGGLQAPALCRRKDLHAVRGRDRRTPHRLHRYDERPIPQEPRRKDVAGTKRARAGRKIWRRQLLWLRCSEEVRTRRANPSAAIVASTTRKPRSSPTSSMSTRPENHPRRSRTRSTRGRFPARPARPGDRPRSTATGGAAPAS